MWRVPKKALLRPLVAAMDAGRLKLAKSLREAEPFLRELQAFQRRITESGHCAFEGVGEHDDLVIAVALACWWPTARKPLRGVRSQHPKKDEVRVHQNPEDRRSHHGHGRPFTLFS